MFKFMFGWMAKIGEQPMFKDPKDGSFSNRKFKEFLMTWIEAAGFFGLGTTLILYAIMPWETTVQDTYTGWMMWFGWSIGRGAIYTYSRHQDKK